MMSSTLAVLAQSILGAVGTIVVIVGLIPTKLGDRVAGYLFDRKLADLKHEQNAKIEELKLKLSRVGDRGIRSNEREYDAAISAWEHFVNAYVATQQCVISFMQYPDLKNMTREDLDSYLAGTDLSDAQQRQVRDASDSTQMYAKVVRHRYIAIAGSSIYDARSVLRKQSIFIAKELEESFEQALQMLHEAQVEQSIQFDHGRTGATRDAMGQLFKEGPGVFDALKDAVRSRIFLAD